MIVYHQSLLNHLQSFAILVIIYHTMKWESFIKNNQSHIQVYFLALEKYIPFKDLKKSCSPNSKIFFQMNEIASKSIESSSKIQKSNQVSPYRKDLFVSHVMQTPKNHVQSYYNSTLSESIEKKIRESRKKEVIERLNDLNNKLMPSNNAHLKNLYPNRYIAYYSTNNLKPFFQENTSK